MNRFTVAVFTFVAGCQAAGDVVERLDEDTGLTVVTDNAITTFARTQGQFSRSARDYLYLGPVEVNERGVREYYFWVGLASTIDRAVSAAEIPEPEMMVFDVGDAPVEFELHSWDQRVPRLAGRAIYDPVVRPMRIFAARVTLDQVKLIAESEIKRVRIVTSNMPTVEYVLWAQTTWWPDFARHAGLR
jgi:hypothetical protein